MSKSRPSYQELEKRLAAADAIIEALKHHQVDAVLGESKIAFLLLQEVTEALRISEAGLRAMFGLGGVGMFQADGPAFRFTKVNPTFCEMTGYSAEELAAHTYIGLTHLQDRKEDMKALTKVLRANSDSWSIEKRCICKDGSVLPVVINGAVLRDESGRVNKIVAVVVGIPRRKAARAKPAGKRKRGRGQS
jgi:PAS domain S-box-containing protein